VTKPEARALALIRRAGQNPALGTQLAAHLLRDAPRPPGAVIAGFHPLPGEIDILPLLHALHDRGHQLALPETPLRGHPLIFRAWTPGAALTPGRFNTLHPTGAMILPDYFLIPLLAFDSTGNRLGYGGGYYDRTLATFPTAPRIGCAFAAQEFSAVPTEPHDLKLHAIATERGVRWF
jgi:5-formyltetrahydrofolate cyclo-ligase